MGLQDGGVGMAQFCSGVLVAHGALGTEEAGVVPSLGIYLTLVHSLSMDSHNMALFYG